MIASLPVSYSTVSWRAMRKALIQFLLLIAALMAGMDTRAMADDNVAASGIVGHHHDFVEPSDDAVRDDNSPTESGGEVVHHHHCPTGLVADEGLASASGPHARDVHLPRLAVALASRSIAPPTQPPAA
jgi:hypothetical protein